jgi:hypothetical protein
MTRVADVSFGRSKLMTGDTPSTSMPRAAMWVAGGRTGAKALGYQAGGRTGAKALGYQAGGRTGAIASTLQFLVRISRMLPKNSGTALQQTPNSALIT